MTSNKRPQCATADPDFLGSAAVGIGCWLATNQEIAGSSPAGRAKTLLCQPFTRPRHSGSLARRSQMASTQHASWNRPKDNDDCFVLRIAKLRAQRACNEIARNVLAVCS